MPKARDRMQPSTQTVHTDHDLAEALARMKQAKIDFLPVVDGDRVIGILTATDLPEAVSESGGGEDLKVRDRMTPRLVFCFEDDDLALVSAILNRFEVDRLLVISRERHPLGVIGRSGLDGVSAGDADHSDVERRVIETPGREAHGRLAPHSAQPKVTRSAGTGPG